MAKQFIVRLRRGSTSGPIVANSQVIQVKTTSNTPLDSALFTDNLLSGQVKTILRNGAFRKTLSGLPELITTSTTQAPSDTVTQPTTTIPPTTTPPSIVDTGTFSVVVQNFEIEGVNNLSADEAAQRNITFRFRAINTSNPKPWVSNQNFLFIVNHLTTNADDFTIDQGLFICPVNASTILRVSVAAKTDRLVEPDEFFTIRFYKNYTNTGGVFAPVGDWFFESPTITLKNVAVGQIDKPIVWEWAGRRPLVEEQNWYLLPGNSANLLISAESINGTAVQSLRLTWNGGITASAKLTDTTWITSTNSLLIEDYKTPTVGVQFNSLSAIPTAGTTFTVNIAAHADTTGTSLLAYANAHINILSNITFRSDRTSVAEGEVFTITANIGGFSDEAYKRGIPLTLKAIPSNLSSWSVDNDIWTVNQQPWYLGTSSPLPSTIDLTQNSQAVWVIHAAEDFEADGNDTLKFELHYDYLYKGTKINSTDPVVTILDSGRTSSFPFIYDEVFAPNPGTYTIVEGETFTYKFKIIDSIPQARPVFWKLNGIGSTTAEDFADQIIGNFLSFKDYNLLVPNQYTITIRTKIDGTIETGEQFRITFHMSYDDAIDDRSPFHISPIYTILEASSGFNEIISFGQDQSDDDIWLGERVQLLIQGGRANSSVQWNDGTSLIDFNLLEDGSRTVLTPSYSSAGQKTITFRFLGSGNIKTFAFIVPNSRRPADRPGPGCPDPATPILISPGATIPAADIEVDTMIYTCHEMTLEYGYYRVIHKQIVQQPKLKFHFDNGTDLTVSLSHRFLLNNNQWTTARDIRTGMILKTFTGQAEITSISKLGLGDVVQLEIDQAHTYIANGFVSHNVKQTESTQFGADVVLG